MPTTDKDIEGLQSRAQKLRDQLSQARLTREERERNSVNDVTAAHLEREIESLEAELALEKERGKVTNVKAGLAAPLGIVSAQDAMAAAAREEGQPVATPAEKKE